MLETVKLTIVYCTV